MQIAVTPAIDVCWCGENAHCFSVAWEWSSHQVVCNNGHTLVRPCGKTHRAICKWNNRTNSRGIKIIRITESSPVYDIPTIAQRNIFNKLSSLLIELKNTNLKEVIYHIENAKEEYEKTHKLCIF